MLKSLGKYVLSVIGAAYVGLLVMVLATTPLRFWFDYRGVNIISSVCCVLGSMIMLFFATMKVGYDEQTPGGRLLPGKHVLLMAGAVGIYVVLTVLFRYYTGAASNVCSVAIVMGGFRSTVGIKEMAAEHGGWMFLSLILQTVPFMPPMIAGYVVGGKKRQRSRDELHKRA